jgi:localization factor PodJL
MRQKVPWNLEGVDPEAREAAKEAARRAGMTLGEWLNHTISDRASKFGVDPRQSEARSMGRSHAESPVAETLDQVASRLNRLTRSRPPSATMSPGAGLAGMHAGMDSGMSTGGGLGGSGMGMMHDPYSQDIEAIVSAAASESERRMRDSSVKTAHALDSVARWMERADERWNDVSRATSDRQERTSTVFSQAFGLMTKRLDDIERKLSDGQQPALKPVWTAMERIEKQIGKLASNTSSSEHLARLENSLSGFETRLADIADKLTTMPSRRPMRRADMGDAVAEIRARQMEIDTGLSMPEPVASRRGVQDEILRGLKGDMAKLASKLDTVRRPVTEETVADYLRDEIGRLHDAVQGLASRDTVDALETAVRDLGMRLIDGRLGGASDGLMEPIERLHADVRKLTSMLGANGEGDLSREVRHIARSLESLGSGPVDPNVLSQLAGDIAGLRDAVTSGGESDRLQTLAEQISDLNRQIAHVGERQIDNLEFASLKSSIEEIRAGMRLRGTRGLKAADKDDVAATPDFVTMFGMQMEALSQKVDQISTRAPDDSGTRDLAARIEALAAKLDERPVEAQPDPALNDLLRALVTKMDDAQKPSAEPNSLDALERQVASLAERLEQPQGGDEAVLATLERAMGDLSTQIETLRSETVDAGERAAERAARQAVSEAMRLMPAAGGAAVAVAFDENLQAIKTAQQVADTRTQNTLEAVHDTLDKVVNRLARLETDMRTEHVAPKMQAHVQPQAQILQSPVQQRIADPIIPQVPQVPFVPARLGGPGVAMMSDEAETPGITMPSGPMAGDRIELRQSTHAKQDLPEAAFDLPMGEDVPLEPGASRPTAALRAAMASASGSTGDQAEVKASFIAAARRAAQAAASEASAAQAAKPSLVEKLVAAKASAIKASAMSGGDGEGGFSRLRKAIDTRRRPILLGLAAIVLTLGVAQVATGLLQSDDSAPGNISPRVPMTAPDANGVVKPQTQLAPRPIAPLTALPNAAQTNTAQTRAFDAVETTASLARSAPPAARNLDLNDRTAAQSALPPVPRVIAAPANVPMDQSPERIEARLAEAKAAEARIYAARLDAEAKIAEAKIAEAKIAEVKALDNKLAMRAPDVAPSAGYLASAGSIQTSGLPQKETNTTRIKISGIDSVGAIPPTAGTPALRKAALEGDPAAVYDLASRLAEGRGAPRDIKLAMKLFERAAADGLPPAQYRLGSFYEKGIGVPRDPAMARSWYIRAAEKGNAKAMHNLAVLLAEGSATTKPDYAGAVNWFSKASEFGVRDSQYNLAILLARGLGTAQDLQKSYVWFAVAAAQGDEDAGKKRDEVGTRLQTADLAKAVAAAQRFKPLDPDPVVNEVAMPASGFEDAPKKQNAPKGAKV